MKKKLLFTYPEMMLGGSTTSLISMLNTIDYNLYEVDLLLYKNRGDFMKDLPKEVNLLPEACKYADASFFSKFMKLGISVIKGYILSAFTKEFFLNRRLGLQPQVMAYAQVELSRKIEKEYDVVIGFLELWANNFSLKKVKAKKKIIWIHVDYSNSPYIPSIDHKLMSRSDSIVCVSEKCLKNFNECFPSLSHKVSSIENILSVSNIRKKAAEKIDFIHNKDKEIRLLTVCRLSLYTKGIDRVIFAMKKLVDEGYNLKWYIIGEGEDRPQIEKMINKLQLEERIILLGKKINPYPYFKHCDLYVMASRNEGKPMAVTEAQILGLPVIVTEYSSAHEQVNHNIDGIVVENNDEGIYYGIKRILDHPQLFGMFKKNIIHKVFGNEEVIEEFYSLIK